MVSSNAAQACHHFGCPSHSVTLDGGVQECPKNLDFLWCPNNEKELVLTMTKVRPNNQVTVLTMTKVRPNNQVTVLTILSWS